MGGSKPFLQLTEVLYLLVALISFVYSMTKVPVMDRDYKLLSLYDESRDKVLSLKLISDESYCEPEIRRQGYGAIKYTDFTVTTQTEYLETLGLSGRVELNVMAAYLSGNGRIQSSVEQFLRKEESTVYKIIRISRKTESRLIDLCSSGLKSCFYDEVLRGKLSPARSVITGEEVGVEVEVFIKIEHKGVSSSFTTNSRGSASLESLFGTAQGSMDASFEKRLEQLLSSQEVKIMVNSNVGLPFEFPKDWKSIREYITNVTSYLNLNPELGRSTNFLVESIDQIQLCQLAIRPDSIITEPIDAVLDTLKRVLKEVERFDEENRRFSVDIDGIEGCFPPSETRFIKRSIFLVRQSLLRDKSNLLKEVNQYINRSLSEDAMLNSLDSFHANCTLLQYSTRHRFNGTILPRVNFYMGLLRNKITCLQVSENPLFLSDEMTAKQVFLILYNGSEYENVVSSVNLQNVSQTCRSSVSACFLVNCENGYLFCKNVTSVTFLAYGDLPSMLQVLGDSDLYKSSIRFMYERLMVFDHLFVQFTQIFMNAMNETRKQFNQQSGSSKLPYIVTSKIYRFGEISMFSNSSLNPVEKLLGFKFRLQ